MQIIATLSPGFQSVLWGFFWITVAAVLWLALQDARAMERARWKDMANRAKPPQKSPEA